MRLRAAVVFWFLLTLLSCSSAPEEEPGKIVKGSTESTSVGGGASGAEFPWDIPSGETNRYPIVFVHGFMGFGRDVVPGFCYWGGFTDLEKELTAAGFTAYTAVVGPISSNWDRACELYAFIRGGTVDYGEVHSRNAGHARYGATYPGVFPQWGQTDPEPGTGNKIHIVVHSMGGQTARVLVHLLENGAPEEFALRLETGGVSPLFTGGKSWVESVTTISTPHDGTTLLEEPSLFNNTQRGIVGFLASLNALQLIRFDFRLEHFGVVLDPGESVFMYAERVYRYIEGSGKTDIGTWDASVEGAAILNRWVKAAPDVYYFSVANEKTYPYESDGFQFPELDMLFAFQPAARFLGSYTGSSGVEIDSSWWENDGVVNTRSMKGPVNGSSDVIVSYSGRPERGVWNYMGVLSSFDHGNTIGVPYFRMVRPGVPEGPLKWYLDMAAFLRGLPAD